jgi:single-stranded-DNA-specific exonuclease
MTGPVIVRRPLAVDPAALRGVHPLLARLLAARGVASVAETTLDLGDLIPVSRMAASEAAADLLLHHRTASSPILVIGDFDADGATSTALVIRSLRAMEYATVDFMVPNRFQFGYGLSEALAELAAARRPGLIITVDNGVSSVAGIAHARSRGIDVLVTDHHLPPAQRPAANVIVNPNLPEEPFPSKALAGVGVAFYVMAALARRVLPAAQAQRTLAALLDLVALGTVADVVPLDRNNRILVEQGLRRIRAGRACPGITALLLDAERRPGTAVAADLAFFAGPRLNAAGRLDDISVGIRCLLADDPVEARELAAVLGHLNRERRAIESDMQDEALAIVADMALDGGLPCALCLFDEAWHQGVVGLVAGKMKERYHRPVVAFARESAGLLKGSARSISGLNIRDVIAEIDAAEPGLVRRFGGHAMAAGLTLAEGALAEFSAALEATVDRHLAPGALRREILSDGPLEAHELDLETAELLRNAGPWGQAFPEPVFDGVFDVCDVRVLKDRHVRFRVRPADGSQKIDALAFNQAAHLGAGAPRRLRLAYRLDVNEYRGTRSAQLLVEHFAPV